MLWGWPKGEKKKSWCQSGPEQRGQCERLPCRKGVRRSLGKGGGTRGGTSALGPVQRNMEAGRTQELLPFWLEFSIIKCCLEDEGHSHLATVTMVGERAAVGSLLGMLTGRIRDCSKICIHGSLHGSRYERHSASHLAQVY